METANIPVQLEIHAHVHIIISKLCNDN